MSQENTMASLHQAIQQNSPQSTLSLIQTGSDVNAVFRYETACTRAIKEATDSKVAEVIISCGKFDTESLDNDDKTPLYVAAEYGRMDIVEMLVSRGCDVNRACARGETPLMAAAKSNFADSVKYLCECNADINKCSRSGESALYMACSKVHTSIVKYLLSNGANVNTKTNDFHPSTGHTPLMAALPSYYNIRFKQKRKSEALEIVQCLLAHGCDINAQFWNGNTAVHLAAECHDVHTVCILAESGADLHIKNKFGVTAFEDSIQPNKQMYDVAYTMLLYGYDIDAVSSIEHPLMTIIKGYNHAETKYFPNSSKWRRMLLLLVNEVIEKSQDLIYKVKQCTLDIKQLHTPMFECLFENQKPQHLKWICRRKIRHSIKTNTCNVLWSLSIPTSLKQYLSMSHSVQHNPAKASELNLAIEEEVNFKQLSDIVKSGIDLNFTVVDQTPLTGAIKAGKVEVCKLLIENGANVNMCDNTGMAPLLWAAVRGDLVLVQELILAGADVNIKDEIKQENALIKAAAKGHFPVMEYLLNKHCSPRVMDVEGRSALHYTCCYGAVDPTISLLSTYGVSPNVRDGKGYTPLHVAASRGHLYITDSQMTGSMATTQDDSVTVNEQPEANYITIAKLLLESGADLNDADENNTTPLDIAVQFKCLNFICNFS